MRARQRSAMARFLMCSAAMLAFISGNAAAEFSGIGLVLHNTIDTPDGPRNVYRLYAWFDHPDDELMYWGNPGAPATTIIRSTCNGGWNTAGDFFNPSSAVLAPSQADIDANPLVQWDTFATIGVGIAEQGSGPPEAPDTTSIIGPDFSDFITGNEFTTTEIAFLAGSGEQARAGYLGDGDPYHRVLMMQLTLPPGDGVAYKIGWIGWRSGVDGNTHSVLDVSNMFFLAPFGRCCTPSDTCFYTSNYSCSVLGGTFIGCQPCLNCPPNCLADIAPAGGDGSVNVNDLLQVINNWGPCQGCPADIVSDGSVNLSDLLAVIDDWGLCE